ncbi:MAG: hypothetical protein AAB431_03010 [Patescibacteria group bacterium]
MEIPIVQLRPPPIASDPMDDPGIEDYLLIPVIQIIDVTLANVTSRGATEVVLEGIPNRTCEVRQKAGGQWQLIMRPPGKLLRALLRRLRFIADLKVESRVDQSSQFAVEIDGVIRVGFHITFSSDEATGITRAVLTILERSQLKRAQLYLVKS